MKKILFTLVLMVSGWALAAPVNEQCLVTIQNSNGAQEVGRFSVEKGLTWTNIYTGKSEFIPRYAQFKTIVEHPGSRGVSIVATVTNEGIVLDTALVAVVDNIGGEILGSLPADTNSISEDSRKGRTRSLTLVGKVTTSDWNKTQLTTRGLQVGIQCLGL